ncbi:MAG: S8 family peptidase [Ignavibacteriae bacterium]|nr:S8 family peptidase [Ignavibacteria bacterium]MBI3365289.1 S8 family peptidase [Ignavibacteriota bacterium]
MSLHLRAGVRFTVFLSLGLSNVCSTRSQTKYWVYFIDKGPVATEGNTAFMKGSPAYEHARVIVQPRALVRRSKVLPNESLLDAADLPVYRPYIDEVRGTGGVPARESRWLNAASFWLSREQIERARTLPCVQKVEPVVVFHGRKLEFREEDIRSFGKATAIDYGASFAQEQMINVPALHTAGITGHGVLIGMLDTGFRWRTHEALRGLKVVAEHDFIFNDDVTANQVSDRSDQDFHGTLTLSLVSGYVPGILVSPAFNASFILGKTEDVRSETRVEEDNWEAAIEWMEASGVDVVSSSLGYDIFDDGTGYTWAHGDFNGRTSVTAKAAARAALLGVVVCNAMGNEGNGDGITGTLITPADADSIISVGAVSFTRELAGFSSTGPTSDGRIKPDVVAPGVRGMICAVPPNSYTTTIDGTSLATPMVAGAAALLLAARPELTPVQVRDILRSTADTIDIVHFPIRPNNFTGWGLVNAFNAALSFGPIFSDTVAARVVNSQSVVSTIIVSRFGLKTSTVMLHYAVGPDTNFLALSMSLDSSMFFLTSGQYSATIPQVPQGTPVRFIIEASDSGGHAYQSPAQITESVWQLQYGMEGARRISTTLQNIPEGYALYQNYPNPFNTQTIIEYDVPAREYVSLKVYNVVGQEIATLVSGIHDAGTKFHKPFDAKNLPSGVFFYRLATPSFTITKKMVLIR